MRKCVPLMQNEGMYLCFPSALIRSFIFHLFRFCNHVCEHPSQQPWCNLRRYSHYSQIPLPDHVSAQAGQQHHGDSCFFFLFFFALDFTFFEMRENMDSFLEWCHKNILCAILKKKKFGDVEWLDVSYLFVCLFIALLVFSCLFLLVIYLLVIFLFYLLFHLLIYLLIFRNYFVSLKRAY